MFNFFVRLGTPLLDVVVCLIKRPHHGWICSDPGRRVGFPDPAAYWLEIPNRAFISAVLAHSEPGKRMTKRKNTF